jgi:L-ascorbate metabolism protein UlaG (beta-lactamase superfamily)
MIEPLLKDDAFLADVAAARADAAAVHLWWLGQSGYLVQHAGRHLLIDPYLSDSLTKKYANTDKPHIRMTRRVIDPARLDFIDVVSSSHNHTDHLDGETIAALRAVNPQLKIVLPEANRDFAAQRLSMDAAEFIGLDDGTSAAVAGFTFHGVPAAHDSIETDELGRQKYMGYVIEVAGSGGAGGVTIYHSGDTRLYDGMVERLRRFPIDIALLPINGASPQRRVAGNLDGREAATLARDIGARLVVPCHYDMFTFNTASPAEFVGHCERIGQRCRVLLCGERLDW